MAEMQKKIESLKNSYNEKLVAMHKKFDEEVAAAQKQYNEAMAELNKKQEEAQKEMAGLKSATGEAWGKGKKKWTKLPKSLKRLTKRPSRSSSKPWLAG